MLVNLYVFVGSTCDDLFQERTDIAEAILKMGHRVILSDQLAAIPVPPRISVVNS